MKNLLFIPFVLFSAALSAQRSIPVIQANSKKALIVEGDHDQYAWNISPEIALDIHTMSKSAKSNWVKFYSDIDSIKVKLKPGEHFDFIVLLNKRDTCHTRIESLPLKNYSKQRPVLHDTIPFVLTAYNNIKIKALLNKIDTLDLKFDSGTTGLLLTRDAIKSKTHLSENAGADNLLQIGNLQWDKLEVYPVQLSGQGTDGRFGWDLFDGKIVEIDYDKNLFIVHTKAPKREKGYSKFDIAYTQGLISIQGELQIKAQKFRNNFLFDNGYQRTIMLDTVLMQEQHYPKDLKVIKKVIMKNGQGKEIPVITVNNERLNLGKNAIFDIPVQLLTTVNPARFKTHILGNEVLKRFNTIIDFQKNVVYLKPNSLMDAPYTDAQ